MMIKFTKSVAAGNDFVIVDNRSSALKGDLSGIARKLCDRFYGAGANGLLLVERSVAADFKMHIFNSDGSEAEMCGNGSRCIALYANVKSIAPADMRIETAAGILKASVSGENVEPRGFTPAAPIFSGFRGAEPRTVPQSGTGAWVKLKLTDPIGIQWNLCLMIHECPYKVNFADTGVPHIVYFVNDLETVEIKVLGPKMRYHEEFSPRGANVNFVKVIDKNENRIAVRTYERGVEDETLACGTGVVASAIISAEAEKLESPVTVETKSGEVLKVYFELVEGKFKNVYLEGKAKLVYEGIISV